MTSGYVHLIAALDFNDYPHFNHKHMTSANMSSEGSHNITNDAIGNPLSTKSKVLETGASLVQVLKLILQAPALRRRYSLHPELRISDLSSKYAHI